MTSIESAITSLLTRDAFMPSCPIAIPSDTAIVVNSLGVQPASLTPRFALCASWPKCMLHGGGALHVEDTPTSGLSGFLSVTPMTFYIALCCSLDCPSTAPLLCSSITISGATSEYSKIRRLLERSHYLDC